MSVCVNKDALFLCCFSKGELIPSYGNQFSFGYEQDKLFVSDIFKGNFFLTLSRAGVLTTLCANTWHSPGLEPLHSILVFWLLYASWNDFIFLQNVCDRTDLKENTEINTALRYLLMHYSWNLFFFIFFVSLYDCRLPSAIPDVLHRIYTAYATKS